MTRQRTHAACTHCKLPAGRDADGSSIFLRGKPCPNPTCPSHSLEGGMTTVDQVEITEIERAGYRLPGIRQAQPEQSAGNRPPKPRPFRGGKWVWRKTQTIDGVIQPGHWHKHLSGRSRASRGVV